MVRPAAVKYATCRQGGIRRRFCLSCPGPRRRVEGVSRHLGAPASGCNKRVSTSYFGTMPKKTSGGGAATAETESSGAGRGVAAARVGFDSRSIPEYGGEGDVVEWFTRAEVLCQHHGVDLAVVLPARLTGGAFAVWLQLPEGNRRSKDDVREALYSAFAMDPLAAYDAFRSRRLQAGESADVYLADLRRLASLYGGVPDRALACAFIAGLPDNIRSTIRAGTRAESLDLNSTLLRTRAVLSDERVMMAAAVAPKSSEPERRGAATCRRPAPRCWVCGKPGHLARACPNGRETASARAPSPGQ